jgi:hypothetical protein
VPSADRQSPIQLLGSDDGCEFMRQGDAPEGHQLVRPLPSGSRPAIRRSDGKDQRLRPRIELLPQQRSQLRRRQLLPLAIRQKHMRPGASGGFLEEA